ncbi:MAG TPA: MarR family transcriptional regulator [Candidatus Dormibacteraeota bacterium]|jgi:DNA-binding CsgD family transcriptional regulator|nr:MarR family transcriptional regulator [Candidatus Dormibacteraeota bacterium]
MLGFRSSRDEDKSTSDATNLDVAKLFFDSFSKRVNGVEDRILSMSADFEKLKMSVEHGQVSDLVLLDRLQNAEKMIKDTLGSIRTALEQTYTSVPSPRLETDNVQVNVQSLEVPRELRGEASIASHVLSPTGQMGSLPSITTPTELQVLTLLASGGPKSAPEIGRIVGRSREHTARLMKKLYEEGYIRRDQTRIPFRYSVVDKLKQTVAKKESKDEGKEPISVPQT